VAKKHKTSNKKPGAAVKRIAPYLTVERLQFAGEVALIRLAEALDKESDEVKSAAAAFDEAASAEDWDAAKAPADELLALLPDNAAVLCNAGALQILSGDPAAAVETLSKAVEQDSMMAPAFYNRGLATYYDFDDPEAGSENLDSAIADLGRAVKIDPRFAPAYLRRGYALFAVMNLNAALKAFEEYSRLVPDDPNGFNNQAFLLLVMDRASKAEMAWARATALPDAPSYAFAGHAVALHILKKREPAIEQYRKAVELDAKWRDDLDEQAKAYNWAEEMVETAKIILAAIKG
jgi:tetratricopeptide (TPR) repeat protein